MFGIPPCSRADFFRGFGNHDPVYAPFTSPVYSNMGLAILGFVVEAVANTTFYAFVEQAILAPLGMANTTPGTTPTGNGTGFIPAGDVYWGNSIGFEDP